MCVCVCFARALMCFINKKKRVPRVAAPDQTEIGVRRCGDVKRGNALPHARRCLRPLERQLLFRQRLVHPAFVELRLHMLHNDFGAHPSWRMPALEDHATNLLMTYAEAAKVTSAPN